MGTCLIPLHPTTNFRTPVRLHVIVSRAAGLRAESCTSYIGLVNKILSYHMALTHCIAEPKTLEGVGALPAIGNYIDPVVSSNIARGMAGQTTVLYRFATSRVSVF
jgi:hypothetical protein